MNSRDAPRTVRVSQEVTCNDTRRLALVGLALKDRVDLEVAPRLQVGARIEGGPWFATTPGRVAVSGHARFVAGVGWSF